MNKKKKETFKEGKVRIIPLGGLNEVGKNMTAFEYGDEIIVIDCGLGFPEDDMLGIDLVIPDTTYLEKNKEKVKAIFLTHGHEDHIGAIPFVLKKLNVPVYGAKLTIGLVREKLIEHRIEKQAKLKTVKLGDSVTVGKFKVEFIRVTHSIADSAALAITTDQGIILHTGDFKVDYTPVDGQLMDFGAIAKYGAKGIDLLLSESTNVEKEGYSVSETTIGAEFDKMFTATNKRIIIATFASNLHRLQQAVNSAVKCNRKVAVVGRSMANTIKIGYELGYITAPEGTIIDIDKIGQYTNNQLVILATGSQGQSNSALARMSAGDHKKVTITSDDLVILSSSAIPGNEKNVGKVIDELEKLGAEVIYNQLADVHVSGHAYREELKLMLALTKPKYFMPVHGEYRFLKHHIELATKMGVKKENCFALENGKTLEMSNGVVKRSVPVAAGIVLVDGLGVGDIGNIVLRDRQMLSENGIIIIIINANRKTSIVSEDIEVVTRGFVYVRENEELIENIYEVAKQEIALCMKNKQFEWSSIKNSVRDGVSSFVYKKTKRQPMILPIITEYTMD